MLTERMDFQGPHGKISAKLDAPDGTPRAYGLFAHCFTCIKDVLAATRISQGLADLGIAQHPKSFVSLDGIDHLVTGKEDAAYVAGVIAAWSARYI
jgi:putative redox protein